MPYTDQVVRSAGALHPVQRFFLIGAAAVALVAAAPSAAHAGHKTISIDKLTFGDDEELIEQLIDLDAEDIDELREEMAEARAEIKEAIYEIEEAREEVKEAPGGGVILNAALTAASAVVDTATRAAFTDVKDQLDDAERDLDAMKGDLSAEEFTETTLAISVLREELAALEAALEDLTDAMEA